MKMRTRKIGTITFGASLIAFGTAFLLHFFLPMITIQGVISFWPIIFIILGLEVLASTFRNREQDVVIYDKTGIILTALLVMFAMGMGIISLFMEYAIARM